MSNYKEWLYPAQKEIEKQLPTDSRCAVQRIGKDFAFESYIVQEGDKMYVKAFLILKVDYADGYKINSFIDESTFNMVASDLEKTKQLKRPNIIELTPTNGRKSFGGKCKVYQYSDGDKTVYSELISYNTIIAMYNHSTKEVTFVCEEDHLSNITLTHVRAFLEFFGKEKMTKQEIISKLLTKA